MRTLTSLKTLAASIVAAGILAVGGPSASAGDYCHSPAPQCYYKTVVSYDYVKKPVVSYVTKYDHCGEPYYAKSVSWQIVKVPVTKQVKVCY
ncbi:MAG: hypothetical protein R3C49_27905 [Planctomycetaceae bacterium]